MLAPAHDDPRLATPTGLLPGETDKLSSSDRRHLARWTLEHAGNDDGRPWWPAAIRLLPLEDRLTQAFDPELDAAWCERERRRVQRSVEYFVWLYGHLQPPKGPPIPFVPWPELEPGDQGEPINARSQADVLRLIRNELRLLLLKARQLGLTWLVLHDAYHLIAFDPETPSARVLALSKHGEDATKLTGRARRIHDLLPPYLRADEDAETRGSLSRFKIAGRGSMISLSGSPAAARQETATLVILDEYGFIKNGNAGPTSTAVEPTAGDDGRIVKLSTGNGRTGDGEALAQDWDDALAGDSDYTPVFLPATVDPRRRSEAWRDRARGRYRSDEDFEQEQPLTHEQALGGQGTVRIYPADQLAAAAALGQAIAEHDGGRYLAELLEQGLAISIDWGDFQTFAAYSVPLAGAGHLVLDELVQGHVEPQEASEAILDHTPAGEPEPTYAASSADSNPPGNNRTYGKVLARRRAEHPGRYPEQHVAVPFGIYKEGGGDRKHGVNTVGYLRRLLKRTAAFVAEDGWRGRLEQAHGCLAIHPRCKTLLPQMRNLERDPKTGKVKKPQIDPRRPETGDHGPDALVPMAFKNAERWTLETADPDHEDT